MCFLVVFLWIGFSFWFDSLLETAEADLGSMEPKLICGGGRSPKINIHTGSVIDIVIKLSRRPCKELC